METFGFIKAWEHLHEGHDVRKKEWKKQAPFDDVFIRLLSVEGAEIIIMYGVVDGKIVKADTWQPGQDELLSTDWHL